MNPWYALALVVPLFLAGTYVSYSDAWRQRKLEFTCAYLGLSILTSLLWTWKTPALSKSEVYLFSLYWDTLMVACYYIAPVLLMGIRPSPVMLFGITLIVLGFLCVKVGA